MWSAGWTLSHLLLSCSRLCMTHEEKSQRAVTFRTISKHFQISEEAPKKTMSRNKEEMELLHKHGNFHESAIIQALRGFVRQASEVAVKWINPRVINHRDAGAASVFFPVCISQRTRSLTWCCQSEAAWLTSPRVWPEDEPAVNASSLCTVCEPTLTLSKCSI